MGLERSSANFSKAMPIDGMGSEYEATTGDGQGDPLYQQIDENQTKLPDLNPNRGSNSMMQPIRENDKNY